MVARPSEEGISRFEKRFFDTLRDIFIGAKIEGQGGFINLMKIKSRYYQKIEQFLKEDIEKALQKYPSFREELFDKLYSFFIRYFHESGSIYFNSTPFHNNIYERIYTNDQDVILFWKTHMLYYVKTDRIFRSMPVEFDGKKFYFDASTIENKKSNEKRDLIYELREIKEDNTIVFNVHYSERGRVTRVNEILRDIREKGIQITEEDLERAFRIFERQSEVDFFINKNAKAFLQEQFKLWVYQYFWDGAKEWTADRVNQLQILKDIAFKIIDFISQFEDELVKIWNKPKFVKNSNYVITLDRIANQLNGIDVIKKILNHQGIEDQIKEWKELDLIDENFDKKDIFNGLFNQLNEKYKFLPIDTKYFKDLELDILGLFDDIDNSLDGWLIKSENYQALNTLLPKFKEKVQTIYIDPPFNLESSDQFLYRTNYKDSTWATLLENRLSIAKDWLNQKGSIFVRCDYNGNYIVRCLMDYIFGKENFRNEIICMRVKKQTSDNPRSLSVDYDNIYFYSIFDNIKVIINLPMVHRNRQDEDLWHSADTQGKYEPKMFFGKKIFPPTERRGWFSQERIDELISRRELRIVCKNCGYMHYEGIIGNNPCPTCGNDLWRVEYKIKRTDYSSIGNLWNDISGYTHNWGFPTENSEFLLYRITKMTSSTNDIIFDFSLVLVLQLLWLISWVGNG